MRVTGVDACRRGWVAVTLDGSGPAVVRVHETLTGCSARARILTPAPPLTPALPLTRAR